MESTSVFKKSISSIHTYSTFHAASLKSVIVLESVGRPCMEEER